MYSHAVQASLTGDFPTCDEELGEGRDMLLCLLLNLFVPPTPCFLLIDCLGHCRSSERYSRELMDEHSLSAHHSTSLDHCSIKLHIHFRT